ncbi:uncharacterized protein LOC133199898 [Saccostrea echinata]|uniref:uncharacterized protein LOC133199898 n=1 Tax=Saccostrea echinata TaxID=191078 RepID=UPI002A81CD76|nr:uncharacterized protein LOC133199898 [Saccostrea echinata]
MEALTVAEMIVEQFITRFGVPEVIHSDQGRQYESRLFKELCNILGIHRTRTTAFHPKSDGMVERFNKTLATMLTAYVADHQHDWDKHLPYVLMAYRSAVHESTGYTPNMLMLGREVSTPLDTMYELPIDRERTTVHEYAWNRSIGKSPKLMNFWYCPYVIVEKHTNLTYKVQKVGEKKTMVIHIDRLRHYGCQRLSFETDVPSDDESGQTAEETIMPLTKVTPRKPGLLCSICLCRLPSQE